MLEEQIEDSVVAAAFQELYESPIWGAKAGHGSFLTFEFGGAPNRKRHGAWHLWIYCCDWVFYKASNVLCSSESDRRHIGDTIFRLNNRKIVSVAFEAGSRFLFKFEDDFSIQICPNPEDQEEAFWHLYCPDKSVVSARVDGFYVEKAERE